MADDARTATAASVAIASLQDVTFAYPGCAPIIHGLDLEIRAGRITAVLGPNGTGKTTLLKLLTGAVRPRTGHVRVQVPIGFVPQLATATFAYSVLDMTLMGRARHVSTFAVPGHADETRAMDALARVGMQTFANRAFDTLSGGERQLVLFARALASDAELLVLDEPMASLDLAHQRTTLHTMRDLVRDGGLTVVFTTHQPEHAAAIADDVVLVPRAAPIQTGTAREMLTAPRLEPLFGIRMQRAVFGERPVSGDTRRVMLVPDWEL